HDEGEGAMYDLLLNADEAMIEASVKDFLADRLPLARLRPAAARHDRQVFWQEMAQLGWFGSGLPESVGGAGLGLTAEVLIHRECGRHLATPNVIASMLAGHIALAVGEPNLAARVARGEAQASLAIGQPSGQGQAYVLDREGADYIVAWGDWGIGLFDHSALADTSCGDSLDDSISLSAAELAPGGALHMLAGDQPLARRGELLLAAAQVGLATGASDLAVGYAAMREQFGKPIGSFQAIKHRCADMAVRQRLAWYQTCHAALKLVAGADDAALQVASALLLASEAARENARACIQIHGGIGFQAECDAHWFIKRAFVYDLAGGSEQLQAARVLSAPEPAW
ncbi:MAG: acyl-CoA dehydrogenase family protein, partial [Nevskiales bacterium]